MKKHTILCPLVCVFVTNTKPDGRRGKPQQNTKLWGVLIADVLDKSTMFGTQMRKTPANISVQLRIKND